MSFLVYRTNFYYGLPVGSATKTLLRYLLDKGHKLVLEENQRSLNRTESVMMLLQRGSAAEEAGGRATTLPVPTQQHLSRTSSPRNLQKRNTIGGGQLHLQSPVQKTNTEWRARTLAAMRNVLSSRKLTVAAEDLERVGVVDGVVTVERRTSTLELMEIAGLTKSPVSSDESSGSDLDGGDDDEDGGPML